MKICPKCKSINVNINITPSAAFGAPQPWKCDDCGFQSYVGFPDVKKLEEEKKTTKENKTGKKKVRRK